MIDQNAVYHFHISMLFSAPSPIFTTSNYLLLAATLGRRKQTTATTLPSAGLPSQYDWNRNFKKDFSSLPTQRSNTNTTDSKNFNSVSPQLQKRVNTI